MKLNVNFLIIFCLLLSCKEVTFKEPQPRGKKNLKAIPRPLQGKYLGVKDDGEIAQDTVVITANGYRFAYFESAENSASEYDEGKLSDSLVVREHRGYYFVNINEKPEWILRVIRQEENGDLLYMAPEQKGVDFPVYLKKLSAEIRIDSSMVNGEQLYQINPTPHQLIGLIEKGFFSRVTLKKIR